MQVLSYSTRNCYQKNYTTHSQICLRQLHNTFSHLQLNRKKKGIEGDIRTQQRFFRVKTVTIGNIFNNCQS